MSSYKSFQRTSIRSLNLINRIILNIRVGAAKLLISVYEYVKEYAAPELDEDGRLVKLAKPTENEEDEVEENKFVLEMKEGQL